MSGQTATAADLGRRSRLAGLPPGTIALRVAVALVMVFVAVWVAYKAFGEPRTSMIVGLNGLTLAGLYFVVASGFTLIFGLMRVVNMAHGSLYMLAGFFALELQTTLTSGEATSAFGSSEAGLGDWLIRSSSPAWPSASSASSCSSSSCAGTRARLRQALITIAIGIIIADQTLAHFGGNAESLAAPDVFPDSVDLPFSNLTYPFFRIFVLLVAIAVGLALWAMIQRTRFGMIVRAGVDDRQMVSALGINIQLVFAIAFFLGAVLAGLGASSAGR